MVTIHDEARPQPVLGELLEEVVVVPVEGGMGAVAQVCAQPGAGIYRGLHLLGSHVRVTEGDDDTRRHELRDEGGRAVPLRRERHQADQPFRRFLELLELVPVGWAHVLHRVRAPGTVRR